MNDDTINKVKNLIRRNLSNSNIKTFQLSWFGGEPLLAYNQVLDITRFSRDLTISLGKTFKCSITTNGTLLTPERIQNLKDAGVTSYQITIDGDKSTHNSIKELGKISAYDLTITNINLIARHTFCYLRFNYTKDNLHPQLVISDLLKTIDSDVKKNIQFGLFKVWQEDGDSINQKDAEQLFQLSVENGLNPMFGSIGFCYTDKKYFDCVFPNGRVGKCDNHNCDEMPGTLNNDGSISWDDGTEYLYSFHLFDELQSECRHCRYVPICWGPCVVKREKMLLEKRG